MGIEHLIRTINKDTERGYLVHSHVLRILTQFTHWWPTEALESSPLKLPTIHVLRLANTIKGLELENLPSLLSENDIATSFCVAYQAVDDARIKKRHTLPCPMGTKHFDTLVRQKYRPVKFSNKLLKHLAPLWETGIHKWNSLLTIKYTSPSTFNYHIQPTNAILAMLHHGDRISPKTQMRTAVDTLRFTLLLPTRTELRKLPKDLTSKLTLIHPLWHAHIRLNGLPDDTPTSYATLFSNPYAESR